jgi:RimJ/RimL family protein N-acetyltransferase
MAQIPELTSARLRLRGWTPHDVVDWRRICADPQTMRHIGDGTPMPPDRAWHALAHMLGHWALRGYGQWAVIEQATGGLVGRAGLYQPEGWPGLEIGWLIDRRRWGEGLATEAAAAAAAWAFDGLAADRLISLIQPGNDASVRVAEKIGARFAAVIDLGGRDVQMFVLEREKWS